MADGPTFACDACGKTFAWKPAIAGKKAKCKCGATLVVPDEEPEASLDDLYDLAPAGPVDEGTTARVAMPAPVAAVATSAPNRGAGGAAIGYQRGPTAREKQLEATANYVDPVRDIYAPVGLLIVGLLSYVGYYMFRYEVRGSFLAGTLVGISVITVIKAILMIGFAFVIAGPVGVSFGGVGTAILKLAAMAVFSDGVETWIDFGAEKLAGNGFFSSMVSFPAVLGIYWVLLIYLFSMDSGDSWMVVMLMTVFSFIARWILVFLLLAWVMNMGGISAPTVLSGAGGSASSGSMVSEATETFNELKDRKMIHEAVAYMDDGHQIALRPSIQAMYDAGATKVYFTVDRDINGHESTDQLVVEMPTDKQKRIAVYKAITKYYDDLKLGDGPTDTGEKYQFIEVMQ